MAEIETYNNLIEPVRNEQVSVTTTQSIICNSRNWDNKRKELIIRNTSTADADIITISLGQIATLNNGVVLKRGDVVVLSTDNKVDCYNGFLSAICETANGKLSIMER